MEAEDLSRAFSRVVRDRRVALKCSQEEFADRIGVHRTYMGGIERARHVVSIYTAYRVAQGLGISLSELMGEVEALADKASDATE